MFNFFNEKMKPKGFSDFLCSCYNQEITSISISFLLHNDNSCLRKFLSFFRNWAAIPYAWEQVAKASQVHGKLEPLGRVYMQISGLLQTLMIIYKEFKLFFAHMYENLGTNYMCPKSIKWCPICSRTVWEGRVREFWRLYFRKEEIYKSDKSICI